MVMTSLYSIVSILYPKDQVRLVGYIEAASGLGLTLGPSVGYVMFEATGFTGVFLVFTGLFLISGCIVNCLIDKRADVKSI